MVKFILCLILPFLLLWSLSTRWQLGSTKTPALGSFFNPFTGFWANAESNINPADQTLHLSTPTGQEVQVVFDDRLVPHIFAQSEQDAYFTQGYVTAMHRLWQMDLSTRATEGRLSEILGPSTLNFDRGKRQLGLAYAAEVANEAWKKDIESYQMLQAYADGVNAYINSLGKKDLPLEYKIIGFRPELWSPYRSAVFTKSMANILASGEKDLESSATLNYFGSDVFKDLFQTFDTLQVPIIPSGTEWNFEAKLISKPNALNHPEMGFQSSDEKEINQSDEPLDIQLGSNNWVVSGSKTKSGAPILANDPHLGLTLPSVWYECHLVLPDYNVYGVSLPGIAGIIIGFNENIAWGTTNAGHDVMDWYQIKWADEAKTKYYLDGEVKDVDYRVEHYKIKGKPELVDTIKYSFWGPIQEEGKYKDLAMRWAVLDAPKTQEGGTFLKLNKAKNLKDFDDATNQYVTPAQNMNFASKNGDIALKICGTLPLRYWGQGQFVQSGDNSENNWQGYIPEGQNPMSINPSQAYLASANQVTTDTTYPYYYNGEPYFEDYRGRMVNRELRKLEGITPEDMMALQYNAHSIKAEDVLPQLLEWVRPMQSAVGPNKATEILSVLSEWNFDYQTTSQAPIYFNLWYSEYYRQVWDEFYSVNDSIPMMTPQSWRTIELTNKNPKHPFFDIRATKDKQETASDIAIISFHHLIEKWDEIAANKKSNWGIYKNTTVSHLGNIPGFSRKVPEAPGWSDALNATSGGHGPSWRMIVEMTDPVKAWVVYPGGQSGNPGSKYYDNMVQEWAMGKYYEAHFVRSPEELKSNTTFTLKIN